MLHARLTVGLPPLEFAKVEAGNFFGAAKGARVKSSTLESFLLGFALGIGTAIFALYSQKPRAVATSLNSIAELGRMRRVKDDERRLQRERLKAVGFSDEEIKGVFE